MLFVQDRLQAYTEELDQVASGAIGSQYGRRRRIVTMLFCDVKGLTAMAENLDPKNGLRS
jgi:class 3 adenylate cyclase